MLLSGNRYEKTCLQDLIEADEGLEKLAPSQDFRDGDNEANQSIVLDTKARVVTRLTVMVQQLQREAVTMGPLVDSFSTALLDLVLTAVSDELAPPTSGNNNDSDGAGNSSSMNLQAISLSDSPALLETVQRIQALEAGSALSRRRSSNSRDQAGRQDSGETSILARKQSNRGNHRARDGADVDEGNSSSAPAPALSSSIDRVSEVSAIKRAEEAAAEVQRVKEAAAEEARKLEQKIAVYHSINPLSTDEMDWLIESKATNAYLVAERHEAEAQKAYGETVNVANMWLVYFIMFSCI